MDGMQERAAFDQTDTITVVLYFVAIAALGIWSTYTAKRGGTASYFLAGRSMTWLPIGASLFASNIGAPMFIGLTGSAAAAGFGVIIYEWHAIFFVLALGWIFVPVYVSSMVDTAPEYLHRRFGGKRLQIYLSALSIFLYVVTKISIEVYSGGLFLQLLLGWNTYLSITIILVFALSLTLIGGLSTVILTDTLQTAVLVVGAFALTGISLHRVGGYENLLYKYMRAVPRNATQGNTTGGFPRPDSMHILRDPVNSDLPWPGTLIGNVPGAILYWCTDQLMVQHFLSAKSLTHAKGGSIVTGYLKILPFFMFIVPGMVSRVLFTEEVACIDPDVCQEICDNRAGCSNIAYPLLVLRLLPSGVRGLTLAAFLAALMSTLMSIFNSASSVATMDLWRRVRRSASDIELILVGRTVIVLLAVVSILWVPIMQSAQGDQLWTYFQSVHSCVGPPWAMVYVIGIFWKRATEQGAFWGLVMGHVIGFIRFVLILVYPEPPFGQKDDRHALVKIHFLYAGMINTLVSTVVVIAISLLTAPRDDQQLKGVTWYTKHEVSEDNIQDETRHEKGQADEAKQCQQKSHSSPIKFLRRICGFTAQASQQKCENDLRSRLQLHEDAKWSFILNVNAVILLAVTIFIIAFYA